MWWNKYVGIPFLEKGRDKEGLDCWGLARLIYKDEFDIDLPSFAEEYAGGDVSRTTELIAQYREGWEKIDDPIPGDLLLFKIAGNETHIGIYIGKDKFIHARHGYSSALENINSINWRNRLVGFYKYKAQTTGAVMHGMPYALRTEQITIPIKAGTSVKDLYTNILEEFGLKDIEQKITIIVNGNMIKPEEYSTTIIGVGDSIQYRAVPGDDNTFRFLLTAAVMVVAWEVTPSLVPAGLTGAQAAVATSLIRVGLMTVGMALVNAIAPIRQPTMPQDPGSPANQLLMSGGSNQAYKYGSIPVVLGKVRMTALLGSQSIIESYDEDSYLKMLLVWGFGPLDISDYRIGATSFDQYDNLVYKTLNYRSTEEAKANETWGVWGSITGAIARFFTFDSIYSKDVEQVYSGIKLVNHIEKDPITGIEALVNPWIELTLNEPDTNRLGINFYFPQGLRGINTMGESAGQSYPIECLLECQYRPLDINGNPISDWGNITTLKLPEYRTHIKAASYSTYTNTNYWNNDGGETKTTYAVYRWTRIVLDSSGNYIIKTGSLTENPDAEPSQGMIDISKKDTYSYASNTVFKRLPDLATNEILLYDVCMYGGSVFRVITNNRSTSYTYTGISYTQSEYILSSSVNYDGSRAEYTYVTDGIWFKVVGGTVAPIDNLISIGINDYTNRKDAFSYNKYIIPTTPGRYQIRVRRANSDETEPNTSHRLMHDVILQYATAYTNRAALIDPKGAFISRTALSIKATDQLNSQIEGINALVQTVCLSWNPSTQTWVQATTNNPADLFRYVLEHPANTFRIKPENVVNKIDLVALQDWNEFCRDKGFTFNSVVSQQRSILDILRDIASAGRASPAMKDGKWTVIIDRPKTDVIQHFTPHNSWGFESSKSLSKFPDGLKVTFNNELAGYQEEELIVYNIGKSAENAEIFEQITLPGTTNPYQASIHARWAMAQVRLRPETYTLNTDLEYIVCNRGDRVKVMHDVPMWGIGSGRIKNKINSTVLELDEEVPVKYVTGTATSYTIRIRSQDGSTVTRNIVTSFNCISFNRNNNICTITLNTSHSIQPGDVVIINSSNIGINSVGATILSVTTNTISYNNVGTDTNTTNITGTVKLTENYYSFITVDSALSDAAAYSGDMFMYGEVGKESQDLLVLSIEPMTQGSAKITLVDYAPELFNLNYLNDFNIPDYSTNITQAPSLLVQSIYDIPTVSTIISDERVMGLISPGVFTYQLQVNYINPTNLPTKVVGTEVQLNYSTDTSNNWQFKQIADISKTSVIFKDVEEGKAYKIRLRYVGEDGRTGPWSSIVTHTVIGKTNPPSNITGLNYTVQKNSGQFMLYWNKNGEIDLAGYEVRSSNTGWGTSSGFIYKGLETNAIVPPVLSSNTVTYYVKAYDVSNNYSTTAISTILSVPEPGAPLNITYNYSIQSITGTTATIKWDTPSDIYFALDHYELIFTSTAGTNIINTYSNQYTTIIDWVSDASVVIKAVDIVGNKSLPSTAITLPKAAPEVPTNITATIVNNSIVLDWSDSIPGSLPVAGYEIRSTNSSWGTSISSALRVSNSNITITNYVIGTNTWYIKAYDTMGQYSTNAATISLVVNLPGNISTITSEILNNTIILDWNDVSLGTFALAGYEIRSTSTGWGNSSAPLSRVLGSKVVLNNFSLGVNTWYIKAFDIAGNYSQNYTTKSVTLAIPDPVTDISLSYTDTNTSGAQAVISWVSPASVTFAIDKYEIELVKYPGPVSFTTTAYATSIQVPVDWRDKVVVNIRTIDILGNYSNTSTIEFAKQKPASPISSSVIAIPSGGVQISWPTAIKGSLPIEGYELRTENINPGTPGFTYRGNTPSVNIPNIALGDSTWYLWTYDTDGQYSTTPLTIHFSTTKPQPATSLTHIFNTSSNTSSTITFKWIKPSASMFNIDRYDVKFEYTNPTTTLVSSRYTTDWELPANWVGTGILSVTVYDVLGQSSTVATYNVTKQVPNTPDVATTSVVGTSISLDWPDTAITTLPVIQYEVRDADSNWGLPGYIWKGTSSNCLIPLSTGTGTYTWYIKAIDTDNKYSSIARSATYTVVSPVNTTTNPAEYEDTSLTAATVTLSWSDILPIFGLKGYEVSYNTPSGLQVVNINSTTIVLPANWLGDRIFTVKTIDNLNNKSTGSTITATKLAPNPATGFRAQVIDNNVLLYWTLPDKTTLPISHVLLKKGISWETASIIGDKSGSFTSISELTGGDYIYWLAVVDTDNNMSTPISIPVTVSQPPDFIFNAEYTVSAFTGTKVNAAYKSPNEAGIVLPVNTTELFSEHFTNKGWSSPSDQVSAGYPIYIQPGVLTGYYEEVFDYGTSLGSSQITVDILGNNVSGTPTVTPIISVSLDGITYIEYRGSSSIFAVNFRYIKVRIEVTRNIIGDLYELNKLNVRLDSKQRNDSGIVYVNTASTDPNGTFVNFGLEFIDVTSITLSAAGTIPRTAVYDFRDNIIDGTYSISSNIGTINTNNHNLLVGQNVRLFFTTGTATSGVYTVASVINNNTFTINIINSNTSGNVSTYPNSMRIYLFDSSGNRVAGSVSWAIRGY